MGTCQVKPENIDKWSMWTRNIHDRYKESSTEDIKKDLQSRAFPAAVLMSQLSGDFNIGSVIRSANFHNLSKVFYYGKRRYDKRGAAGVYNYTDVIYLESFDQVEELKSQYNFVALENNINRKIISIKDYQWIPNSLIIIGEENSGIEDNLLELCNDFIEIPSFGSVRSLNAASAATCAMYDYTSKIKIMNNYMSKIEG
jgi:tRNA G18 (ribose-2'-O)-methylase SpoU